MRHCFAHGVHPQPELRRVQPLGLQDVRTSMRAEEEGGSILFRRLQLPAPEAVWGHSFRWRPMCR